MEKKNIKFEDNGNSIAMRYELLPSDQLDDAALEKMKAGQLEMAAPIQYGEEEGRRMLYAYIPASVQLSTFLKRQLGKGEVLTILRNLVAGMDIGKNNIPVAYIIKDMDYIYIEEQTLRLFTFIVPIKGQTVEVTDVPDFMREVVSRMKFRDEDKDNYVARLLTNINSDRFSLNELNVLVNEMLLDLGDAQLAGVPQGGPAKVDRVGVMRNRAGAMPPQQQMFNPQTGQPMQPQMQQMGQPQFNPMTGQPMQQQAPQQMQPQMGQQQFNPMTGQPMQQQAPQQMQPQMGQQQFNPMTGQPMQQQMPQQQMQQPQMGQPQQFNPMTGQPIQQQAPQAPVAPQQAPIQQPQMQQAPKPQEPEKKFDPMTGKPIGGPAPQGPVAPQTPKPQEPEKKFDPMTGQPLGGPAPQGPTPTPAPQQAPQGSDPEKKFDPMTGKPINAPEPPKAPQEPEKKFDPMTGKPLGGPAPQGPVAPEAPKPQGPVPTPAPQQAPQGPVAPQAPQQPQMQQPEPPKAPQGPAPQGPTAGPVPTPGPQTPQGPAQPQAPQQPGPQKSADDMFSIDDLMKMEEPEKSEAPAPEAPAEPAKPHFVREKTGEKIFIDKEEFKIGKSKVHSDYSIENNSAISRVHVIVIKRGEDCFLKDNDSTNGTYVDGDRLEPGREVQLKENMEIKFGDEDFVFHEK